MSRRIFAARLVATVEAEEAEVPISGGQGASRHVEEHGQSGKYKEVEEMHREALAIMERAFRVNDIFAIGYGKQLSIQRPADPFKGCVVYSHTRNPRLFFKTRMVASAYSLGFDDGVTNDPEVLSRIVAFINTIYKLK
jgi:hypothetical protein